jgi:phosphatidylglycerol:prolipoprotein diacylglycerol transferase
MIKERDATEGRNRATTKLIHSAAGCFRLRPHEAMIPYIHVPDLPIGPITLHPFGLLVATGVIIGTSLATHRAARRGVDLDLLNSFITWILVAGFVGGHMLDQIFYHPADLARRPWSLFLLWEGLSSFGGFSGGVIGAVLWKYFEFARFSKWPWFQSRKTPMPILPFCDIIISVFPVAWIFGRSGCSVVHDHPGAHAPNDALLAVAYGADPSPHKIFCLDVTREGHPMRDCLEFLHGQAPQWDLGLLELMFTICLAGLVALTWKKRLPTGTYVAVICMAYAPMRFVMDFFRIRDVESADPRYASLTPAQWCCVAMFLYGLAMLSYTRKLKAAGVDPIDRVLAREHQGAASGEPEPA